MPTLSPASRPWAGLLPLFLLLTLAASAARAWGPAGHQAVGAIADRLIQGTPAAKKVKALLGSNLQTASVWADCARSVQTVGGKWVYVMDPKQVYPECAPFEKTEASKNQMVDYVRRNASLCDAVPVHSKACRHKAYHFVDLPIQHPHYKVSAPGTAPTDLVQTLNALLAKLTKGKPAAVFNFQGDAEALRLLTHFVGDVHQPLHVGSIYLDDAGKPLDPATDAEAKAHDNSGGNTLPFEGRNLHKSWDGIPDSIYKPLVAGQGQTEAAQVQATPGDMAGWPTAWADETATEAAKAFQDLTFGAHVKDGNPRGWPTTAAEPAYRQAQQQLQRAQIIKAGARLAKILTNLWP